MWSYTLLALIAAVLHVIWERSHIGLYTDYEAMEGSLPVYLFATLGDVAYTLGAVALFALLKGELIWFREPQLYDFIGLVICGLCIALFVEYKAMILHRWAYTDAMPLLYGFGISPLVQMTLLLPFSVAVLTVVERYVKSTLVV